MRPAHLAILVLAFCLCPVVFSAQNLPDQVEVTRNVNLRAGPSSSEKILDQFRPPERLDLVDSEPTDNYFHVKTEEGQTGWVYSRNVKRIAATERPEVVTESAVTAGQPAANISPQWRKAKPKKTVFHGKEGDCPPEGNGFDPDQYILKNRVDIPTSYHDVTWQAIDDLDSPDKAPMQRKDWTEEQLSVIEPSESVPVRIVGYLVAVKPQNGSSGEGTNCKFTKAGDTDFHLAIVKRPGDGESESIVVEFTPRFLQNHPKWTKKNLSPWLDSDNPVRISGFTLFDPDHTNHLGRYRDTLWEIHPITKFEVFKGGKFIDLDSLP